MPPSFRVLIAGALFATGGALIKSCEFPSLQRAGCRAAIAALTIFLLMPEARRLPNLRILRLALPYFGATCLFVVANTMTTAASAIFLQSTATLWLIVLGPLVLRERLARRDVFVLLGVATGMVLCFTAPTSASATAPDPQLGDWIAILSGISYAFLLLGMRWLARSGPGEGPAAIAWGSLLTAPMALLVMPVIGQQFTLGTTQDWLVVGVLGVFQVGLAYSLLVRAIEHVPAVRVSLLLMIEPALNPVIAYIVHGEAPPAMVFVGGGVILGTVLAGAVVNAVAAARLRRGASL